MRSFLRVSLVVLAGSSGCVGGPVSDWPARGPGHNAGDDDENTSAPPKSPTPTEGAGGNPGAMDAGLSAPSGDDGEAATRDAGADGGVPCTADAGACRASCDGDAGVAPVDPAVHARLGCEDEDEPGFSD